VRGDRNESSGTGYGKGSRDISVLAGALHIVAAQIFKGHGRGKGVARRGGIDLLDVVGRDDLEIGAVVEIDAPFAQLQYEILCLDPRRKSKAGLETTFNARRTDSGIGVGLLLVRRKDLDRTEVFKREKELTEIGLGVPQITRLIRLLRERGIDIRDDLYTVEAVKRELAKMLPRSGRGGGI